MSGKVVVNRATSLDGFIAETDHARDWRNWPRLGSLAAPEDYAAVAAASGAMLVGRRTWDVGDKMAADEPGATDYPFTGRMFLLTHRPPDDLDPGVTVLSGDIGDAVAAALDAAAGKDLELLGADVARQALNRGLVDELLVYVLPVLVGAGVPMSAPGLERVDLELVSTKQSGATAMLRYRVRRRP